MSAPPLTAALFTGLALAALAPAARAQALTENEAAQIGTAAYIYGYPLVTMEYTRRVMTNATEPKGNHAPMGQFFKSRVYPDAKFRDVTAPNADTLYSTAWLDLTKEPYVLSLPDMGDRYFLMPMLSAWTDVFQVPGTRTTGNKAQTFAVTGPGWTGTLPAGVKELKAPTNIVWVLGRTYCTGTPEDYKACHAVMDKYDLRPLSAWGKPYAPPAGTVDPAIDTKTAVRERVHALDAGAYFATLAALMKDNPPAKGDAPMVEQLARIGVVPGKGFDPAKLDPAVAKGLATAPKAAQAAIIGNFKNAGKEVNGWQVMTKTGLYGTEYLQRAFVTAVGLGANRPEDAVYPTSVTDATGKKYSGANKYVVHFDKGQVPPVKAFWSITMYDAGYFFVANPLNKYTVSPRNDLTYNPDGSLDLFIQHESPGKDKEANWLPAPKGEFVLMLRMYWPEVRSPSVIDGSWKPPPVTPVK
ncbi:DUF1254 domain-containing protein [Frigoriglobus tundricola]|uniref:DUF1254 domain-containing protein n=1 Tax=Frigoriglobus tundricola TaxID=2774151 RepID=A0A6M5YXD0_9BACT|nr:DUF1254 domain-containing protein [Frigoriglobus tundricola]QJW98568.1 hypothetical protein FTUN_6163 [Frigoriglobus tundricola]